MSDNGVAVWLDLRVIVQSMPQQELSSTLRHHA